MNVVPWSFVDLASGRFLAGVAWGDEGVPAAQRPGLLPVIGLWDPLAWRYDLELQQVVPNEQAESERARQRALSTEAATREAASTAIMDAERSSARALREVVLALLDGIQPPAEAVTRLREADAAISVQRPLLTAQSVQPTA